ncbi:hypothetical protein GCM10029964_019520 [Kibdelosporangium lantanae]
MRESAAFGLLAVFQRVVGDNLPVVRRGHRERVHGLEVGLVEAGEHPLRVRGLELRVQVHGVVDRVDEPVQALAGVHVPALRADDQLVGLGQVRQGDAVVLAVAGHVQLDAVEHGRLDLGGDQVHPGGRAGLPAGEPDHGV